MTNISPSYSYKSKSSNSYVLESQGEILLYSEFIKGAGRVTNYFWSVILFLFGFGFLASGFSSYFVYSKISISFVNTNTTDIEFIPQGILLLFYGSCAILLSILISIFVSLDIGSGTNIYDLETEVIRIARKGFPKFTGNLSLIQSNIYLVYPFSQVLYIELEIINGLNPKRVIYLYLKDSRRIPLTPLNQIDDFIFLEKRAIFIAKLLKIELRLKNSIE